MVVKYFWMLDLHMTMEWRLDRNFFSELLNFLNGVITSAKKYCIQINEKKTNIMLVSKETGENVHI